MAENEAQETNIRAEPRRAANERSSSWGHAKRVFILAMGALLLGAAVFRGITTRARATALLVKETREMAIQAVTIIHPKRGASKEEVVLPGNIQAFVDSPIYARTSGYLKRWYVDIGAHVKAGDLLAEIDTPETDQQLEQARADLATAEANYHLAETTAARWEDLLKTDSVSRQETEQKIGDLQAKKATMDSARFNVNRLEKLQSFEKIYAPFDGVIIARNTDIGALIDAGAGGSARELFHLADTRKLRVYVNVPQIYSRSAVPGMHATLTLAEFPGRSFGGTVVRTADAIDPGSRTLLVEIDVENPSGRLLPGAFAEVHLKLPSVASAFILPVNSLLFRSEGLRVAAVKEGKAELLPIVLGKDFGTEVEVVSGLTGNEAIVANPPDSLISGEQVRVASDPGAGGQR